jgi:hypothetical protein
VAVATAEAAAVAPAVVATAEAAASDVAVAKVEGAAPAAATAGRKFRLSVTTNLSRALVSS